MAPDHAFASTKHHLEKFYGRQAELLRLASFFENLEPHRLTGTNTRLLHHYGVAGVGKTQLLLHALAEARRLSFLALTAVDLDSTRWTPYSAPHEFFWEVRNALREVGIPTPWFDCAYLVVQKRAQPGIKVQIEEKPLWATFELGEKGGDVVSKAFRAFENGDELLNFCSAVFAEIGVSCKGLAVSRKLVALGRQYQFRKLHKKTRGCDLKLETYTTLLGHLPCLLGCELAAYLMSHPSKSLCLAIDGLENIQSGSTNRNIEWFVHSFLESLCNLPLGVRHRIGVLSFGRERIRWDELYEDAQSWRERWQLVQLAGLTHSEAERYLLEHVIPTLESAGKAEASNFVRAHVDHMIVLARDSDETDTCSPYSLRLAAELVERRGASIEIGDLGRTPDELQHRFLKSLAPGELRTLQVLALSLRFDQQIYRTLVDQRIIIDMPAQAFPLLVNRYRYATCPDPAGDGCYRFHSQMSRALFASQTRTNEENAAARAVVEAVFQSLLQRCSLEADVPTIALLSSDLEHALTVAVYAFSNGIASLNDLGEFWASAQDVVPHHVAPLVYQGWVNYNINVLEHFGAPADLVAKLNGILAQLQVYANEYASAEETVLETSDTLQQSAMGEARGDKSEFDDSGLLITRAESLLQRGKLHDCIDVIKQVRQNYKTVSDDQIPWKVYQLEALARANGGNRAAAIQLVRGYIAAHHELAEDLRGDLGSAKSMLGGFLVDSGKTDEAEPLLLEARILLEPQRLQMGVAYGDLLIRIGDLMLAKNRYAEAKEVLLENYRLQKRYANRAGIAIACRHLTMAYMHEKDFEEGLPIAEEGLAVAREVFSDDVPQMAFYYYNLGYIRHGQERFAEAEEMLEKALALMVRNGMYDAQRISDTRLLLLTALIKQGKDDKAHPHFRKLEDAGVLDLDGRNHELPSYLPVSHRVAGVPHNPRNKPCPCGSGKKYKRCCGTR